MPTPKRLLFDALEMALFLVGSVGLALLVAHAVHADPEPSCRLVHSAPEAFDLYRCPVEDARTCFVSVARGGMAKGSTALSCL